MGKNDKAMKAASHGPWGFAMLLAYIGSAVYFVEQSSGFWGFIGALFKAVAWPAIIIYNALEAFHV
jgi:hypothetical protein